MIYGTRLTFFLLKANAHRCSLAVAVTCKSSHNAEWAITIIKSAQSCSITMVKDHSDLQPSILPAAAFTHWAPVYTLRTALELLMPLSMNKWQVKQLGGWGFLCWLFLPHSNFHNLRLKLGFSYSQHMKVHSGEKWGFQSEQVQLLNALGPLGKFQCSWTQWNFPSPLPRLAYLCLFHQPLFAVWFALHSLFRVLPVWLYCTIL